MSSSKTLVTHNYKLSVAKEFIASFDTDNYYMFAGNNLGDPNSVPQPNDTVNDTLVAAYRSMLFGKKINKTDTSLVINNNTWASGTVYSMYDDEDSTLFIPPSQFYTIVNEGANYYVYKCLENNNGGPSTVQPAFADTIGAYSVFYPADGYRWKLMYSITSTSVTKFGTSVYFPIVSTTGNTSPGRIDVIKVDDPGRGYDNYFTGTFSTADIRLGGNTTVYALNGSASSNSDFYTGCYIYISSGVGAGQYRLIQSYQVNATSKYIVIDRDFDTTPLNNTQYQINPAVVIVGDGNQSVNAAGMAIINAVGNTVQRIAMLNNGQNYTYAAASVSAAPIVGVSSNAIVRPIYPPTNGHGYDPASELNATHVAVNVQFVNDESQTIVANNDYSTVGVIKNPLFANVVLTIANTQGVFITNETVYKVKPLPLSGVVSINTTSSVANVAGASLANLTVGSQVIVSTNTTAQFTTVQASNATTVTMASNGLFVSTNAVMSLATPIASGTLLTTPGGALQLTGVNGVYAAGDQLIGAVSGAKAVVNNIQINGLFKGFNTFTQTWIYEGNKLNSDFIPDETVYQGNTGVANASFVASANVGGVYRMYLANQVGIIATGNNIIGANSGAVASVVNKYVPDLVFGSGQVLYLENDEPIHRSNTQTETFKVVLEF